MLYGIIGDPVQQALSPVIHNIAISHDGIDAVFLGFKINKGSLKDAVQAVKTLGIRGLAVTMPNKQEMLKYLDEIDPLAKKIGAVNVVSISDEQKFLGYNTDGLGFLKALDLSQVNYKDSQVLLFGAGGAAGAIAMALLNAGIRELCVCNKFEAEARILIQKLKKEFKNIDIKYLPFEKKEIADTVSSDLSLIINATCLGMKNQSSEHVDLVPWYKLHKDVVVFDIVHSPLETTLILKANELGFKTITGDNMLLYQGVLAYEILFKRQAPVTIMKKSLHEWLSCE